MQGQDKYLKGIMPDKSEMIPVTEAAGENPAAARLCSIYLNLLIISSAMALIDFAYS